MPLSRHLRYRQLLREALARNLQRPGEVFASLCGVRCVIYLTLVRGSERRSTLGSALVSVYLP